MTTRRQSKGHPVSSLFCILVVGALLIATQPGSNLGERQRLSDGHKIGSLFPLKATSLGYRSGKNDDGPRALQALVRGVESRSVSYKRSAVPPDEFRLPDATAIASFTIRSPPVRSLSSL
jgi:hypothetical protein